MDHLQFQRKFNYSAFRRDSMHLGPHSCGSTRISIGRFEIITKLATLLCVEELFPDSERDVRPEDFPNQFFELTLRSIRRYSQGVLHRSISASKTQTPFELLIRKSWTGDLIHFSPNIRFFENS